MLKRFKLLLIAIAFIGIISTIQVITYRTFLSITRDNCVSVADSILDAADMSVRKRVSGDTVTINSIAKEFERMNDFSDEFISETISDIAASSQVKNIDYIGENNITITHDSRDVSEPDFRFEELLAIWNDESMRYTGILDGEETTISFLTRTGTTDSTVIRVYTPVRKDNRIIGFVYCKSDIDRVLREYAQSVFGGGFRIIIVSRTSGEIVSDFYGEAPTNIRFFKLVRNEGTDDYSGIVDDMLAGNRGNAYLDFSLDNRDDMFMVYKPMEILDWTIAINGSTDDIFYTLDEVGDIFVSISIIEIFICVMFFIYLYDLNREGIASALIEERVNKAEEMVKSKSIFLFNMSHDIRTPMNAILGFIKMAKKYSNDPAKVIDSLSKAEGAGDQLLALINEVLDMASIENNKIEIKEVEGNLIDIIKTIEDMNMRNAAIKDQVLDVDYTQILDSDVYVDVAHLNQILLNLVSNAIKYTGQGGRIGITVKQDIEVREVHDVRTERYGRYTFIVTDNGIGMSDEFKKHVFDSFSREKSTTSSGIQGTGLGMAITQNLVGLMGGTIDVESTLGVGTIFTVVLELRIQPRVFSVRPTETESTVTNFKGRRLLLVEDNELNREIARDLLESEEFTIEEAEDGSIAIDMVSSKPAGYYDLILMDIQMPNVNGYTATQRIRALEDKVKANVPIVAMTANAFEEDKKKALDSGMNDHLAKPINLEEVIKTLRKYLK